MSHAITGAPPVERWIEIARSLFPKEAEVSHPPMGESVWMKVRWKIRGDPRRPEKPARGVNIYFTREFCKSYQGLNQTQQSEWDDGVRRFLSSRYASFVPDHNAPHGAPVPEESWFVTPDSIR